MNDHLTSRWASRPAKRILSLDGGGIRGALSLGFLLEMESILRKQHNNPNMLLSDYFDLIIGTSTGSIIASGLAVGMSVNEIKDKYLELGGSIFATKRKPWVPSMGGGVLRYFLSANYSEKPLEAELKATFSKPNGDFYLMGDEDIKTGLCLVAKRADTFSTWLFNNNPKGKFYEMNKGIPVWEIVRASSAAPTYFKPKVIKVDKNEKGAFVDGGVSSANNPALMAFLMASVTGFELGWKLGSDKLLIHSIGTGYKLHKEPNINKIVKRRGALWGAAAIDMFMSDANYLNQMILQSLSNSRTAQDIDMQVGDLSDDMITGDSLFSYNRYSVELEKDKLAALGFNFTADQVDNLVQMDKGQNAGILYSIGQKKAQELVDEADFPEQFKVDLEMKTE